MRRLTLLVSGNVQQAGYRNKIVGFGSSLGLTGYAENLPDGRVKVVAEGEERKLDILKEIADIKNALIEVENIESSFSDATGEFSGFFKHVKEGETDERLDRAAELLKELIEVNRSGFSSLKSDTSAMLEKQDSSIQLLGTIREDTSDMKSTLSRMEENQDKMLKKQDRSVELLETIKEDASEMKSSLSTFIEEKFREHEREIAEIKATLARMQAAG